MDISPFDGMASSSTVPQARMVRNWEGVGKVQLLYGS